MRTDERFLNRKLNAGKLRENGFRETEDGYRAEWLIHAGQYRMELLVGFDGQVSFRLFDIAANLEYELIHVSSARGPFVTELRKECDAVLKRLADDCFDADRYRTEQTERIITWIEASCRAAGEHPWKSAPDYMVFRHADNRKWFAVLLVVPRNKLKPEGNGEVEILNVKLRKETLEEAVSAGKILPAYHMSHRHWGSVLLDGTLQDEEIHALIQESFQMTETKKRD